MKMDNIEERMAQSAAIDRWEEFAWKLFLDGSEWIRRKGGRTIPSTSPYPRDWKIIFEVPAGSGTPLVWYFAWGFDGHYSKHTVILESPIHVFHGGIGSYTVCDIDVPRDFKPGPGWQPFFDDKFFDDKFGPVLRSRLDKLRRAMHVGGGRIPEAPPPCYRAEPDRASVAGPQLVHML